jgi:hypothetical protein
MLTGEQRTAIFRLTNVSDLIDASPGRIADMADHVMHRHRALFAQATKGAVVSFLLEVRGRIRAANGALDDTAQRSVSANLDSASL